MLIKIFGTKSIFIVSINVLAFFSTGAAQVKPTGRLGQEESKFSDREKCLFSDIWDAILNFTEKGKMVKGNFMQDDVGGGGACDDL